MDQPLLRGRVQSLVHKAVPPSVLGPSVSSRSSPLSSRVYPRTVNMANKLLVNVAALALAVASVHGQATQQQLNVIQAEFDASQISPPYPVGFGQSLAASRAPR